MRHQPDHRQAVEARSNPGFRRWALLGVIVGALGVFAVANAHLVYVSFQSEPACVDHRKAPGPTAGAYRAAKSAC